MAIQDDDMRPNPKDSDDWFSRGNCRGGNKEPFFPDKGDNSKKPKEPCVECSVRETCLEYAIEHKIRFGIWGGATERERRRIIRQRALERATAA